MTQNNAAIPSLLADAVEKELTNVIKKKDWEMLEKEKYFQISVYNDDTYLKLLLPQPQRRTGSAPRHHRATWCRPQTGIGTRHHHSDTADTRLCGFDRRGVRLGGLQRHSGIYKKANSSNSKGH